MGITKREVESNSFLSLKRDYILKPLAADDDHLSSAASDGGAVGAFSIASAVPGTEIFRSVNGKIPMIYGRRLSVIKTDNSGADLALAIRFYGERMGVKFIEDIAFDAAGTETVVSQRVYDGLYAKPKVLRIANNAASDTIKIGFDGKWFGLENPFVDWRSLRMIQRIVAGTPDAAPKYAADIASAHVKAVDAAVDLSTIFGGDVAVTHEYIIEYLTGGTHAARRLQFKRDGLRFGES